MRSNLSERVEERGVDLEQVRDVENDVFAARPLRSALSQRAPVIAALPSMPTTSRARVASGSVKLPSPQNRSATRSSGCTSSSRSARPTSTRLIDALTCVKSVGVKRMRTPNSGRS